MSEFMIHLVCFHFILNHCNFGFLTILILIDPENKVELYADNRSDTLKSSKYVGGFYANDRFWELVIHNTKEFFFFFKSSDYLSKRFSDPTINPQIFEFS